MSVPIDNVNAFLAGVRVGKWLKLVDVRRKVDPPFWTLPIITEDFEYLLTEEEVCLMIEEPDL